MTAARTLSPSVPPEKRQPRRQARFRCGHDASRATLGRKLACNEALADRIAGNLH
jgi:hypothetical protein